MWSGLPSGRNLGWLLDLLSPAAFDRAGGQRNALSVFGGVAQENGARSPLFWPRARLQAEFRQARCGGGAVAFPTTPISRITSRCLRARCLRGGRLGPTAVSRGSRLSAGIEISRGRARTGVRTEGTVSPRRRPPEQLIRPAQRPRKFSGLRAWGVRRTEGLHLGEPR